MIFNIFYTWPKIMKLNMQWVDIMMIKQKNQHKFQRSLGSQKNCEIIHAVENWNFPAPLFDLRKFTTNWLLGISLQKIYHWKPKDV